MENIKKFKEYDINNISERYEYESTHPDMEMEYYRKMNLKDFVTHQNVHHNIREVIKVYLNTNLKKYKKLFKGIDLTDYIGYDVYFFIDDNDNTITIDLKDTHGHRDDAIIPLNEFIDFYNNIEMYLDRDKYNL